MTGAKSSAAACGTAPTHQPSRITTRAGPWNTGQALRDYERSLGLGQHRGGGAEFFEQCLAQPRTDARDHRQPQSIGQAFVSGGGNCCTNRFVTRFGTNDPRNCVPPNELESGQRNDHSNDGADQPREVERVSIHAVPREEDNTRRQEQDVLPVRSARELQFQGYHQTDDSE